MWAELARAELVLGRFVRNLINQTGLILKYHPFPIVANRKLASTNKRVAFRSVHTWIEPPFLLKNILCDHCLHDSGLYIQKILTKRDMINCQKFNFLLFLPINSVTTAVRELNGTNQISLVTHDAKGEMREI